MPQLIADKRLYKLKKQGSIMSPPTSKPEELKTSKNEFDMIYDKAVIVCRENGDAMKELISFKAKREYVAYYEIANSPATFDNISSSPAEQNHSSVSQFLTKDFCDDLHVLLFEMLKRHHNHCLRIQYFLTEERNRCIRVSDKSVVLFFLLCQGVSIY